MPRINAIVTEKEASKMIKLMVKRGLSLRQIAIRTKNPLGYIRRLYELK